MNKKTAITVPPEVKESPIAFFKGLVMSLDEVTDAEMVKRRLALIAAAQAWAKQYGKQAEPILRHALATRLIHERRLGELLIQRPPSFVSDENRRLAGSIESVPSAIKGDRSMYAQTLARVPKGWLDEVIKGIIDGTRRRAIKEIYLQARRMSSQTGDKIQIPENLIIGDFREVQLPKESAALIFTDPPYDRRNLPLYEALAEFGSHVLLPGGSLLVYAPHYALPQVLSSMGGKLRYFWTIAVIHKGRKSLMWEYGIRVWFKPLLWYVKGDRYNKQSIIRDVIESEPGKYDHEWQQSIVEAKFTIEHLTEPGDLIIDPLAGSGTTLMAADDCNRRWLGIEQDLKTAQLATERLMNSKVKPENNRWRD